MKTVKSLAELKKLAIGLGASAKCGQLQFNSKQVKAPPKPAQKTPGK